MLLLTGGLDASEHRRDEQPNDLPNRSVSYTGLALRLEEDALWRFADRSNEGDPMETT